MNPIKALGKLIQKLKEFLLLIDSRIRLWGTILIFIFSIVVLLLFSDKIQFNEWYVYLFFIVVIIVALGIVVDLILPDKTQSFKNLISTGNTISGTWGEFMHDHEYIALSIIKIKFNIQQLQFIIEGEAFNHDGEKVADWKSNASAVSKFTPPEIYYFWEGTNYKPVINAKSGMGVLNFLIPDEKKKCIKAHGWYTSEDFSTLDVTKKYRVEVIRLTSDEEEMLNKPKEELRKFITERIEKWKK